MISRGPRLTKEMQHQFDSFFADKANVSMSSYKVDAKTGLPILYLQDTKSALWDHFSEAYPNGMHRTTFMAQLQEGRYKYHEDLGGLCSICSEYGYEVFAELTKTISQNIEENNCKVCLY